MRSRYRCSMCPAIHINSRSWLRSSSTHEPSDPPLRVVICVNFISSFTFPPSAESRRLVRATNCVDGHRPDTDPSARRRGPSEKAFTWKHTYCNRRVVRVGERTACRRRRLGDRHGDSLDLAESVLHPRGSRAERDRYPRIRVDVDEICERAVRESGRFKTVCHPNAFTERVDGHAGARPPADSRCIGASPPTARTACNATDGQACT